MLSAATAIEPRGKSPDTGPGGSSQPSFSLGHSTVQATELTEGKGLTLFSLLFTLQGAKVYQQAVRNVLEKSFLDAGIWPGQRRIRGLSVVLDVQVRVAHGLGGHGCGDSWHHLSSWLNPSCWQLWRLPGLG